MLILTLRTDKPKSEIGLYKDGKQLAYFEWQAHRELAESIHLKLKELLELQKLAYKDLEGIVIYKGPGSFTGLRIGFSVANALADSIQIPIVSSFGDKWINEGIQSLTSGGNEIVGMPNYGAAPKTTTAQK